MSESILNHPVIRKPDPNAILAACGGDATLAHAEFARLTKIRNTMILSEQADPLRNGWEPPIWRFCDALLGLPWVPVEEAKRVQSMVSGRRITVLLIMGANRSSKTTYAAKRAMRLLHLLDGEGAWCYHENNPNSIRQHHKLMWHFMPPESKKKTLSEVEGISYNQKNGFSGNAFVLRNGSECEFRNYMQEESVSEGGEPVFAWLDEHAPADLIETCKSRVSTRDGWLLSTFTPTKGYSPAVGLFLEASEVVLSSPAYFLPVDGGPPDVESALGLTPRELAAYERALDHREPNLDISGVPGDPDSWVRPGRQKSVAVGDREFELVPRVVRCHDPERAVVYFHGADNPYGNPLSLYRKWKENSIFLRRERLYGIPHKQFTSRFTSFDSKVHVVRAADVPKSGRNFIVVDPAGHRNFFMVWFRVTEEGTFIYREWPGSYDIPGVGLPGEWAIPAGSAKRKDGRPGEAQDSFGFSLLRYKFEIARLERWDDYARWREAAAADDMAIASEDLVREWDEQNGAKEVIEERYIDSRFASARRMENDRPSTLLTECDEIGLCFQPTPGEDIDFGCEQIVNGLSYDKDQEVGYLNKPSLWVSEDCRNVIFALSTWTGLDGQKGATKDPIDCIRYFLMLLRDLIGERLSEDEEDDRFQGGGMY